MFFCSEMEFLIRAGLIIDPLVLAVVGVICLFIVWLLGGGNTWIRTKLLV